LLRGVPSTQSAQLTYAQQPNQTAQLLGAGLGAYGALGRKEGGQIKKYEEGGQIKKYGPGGDVSPTAMSTMAVQELPSRLKRLSDDQLAAYARTVKDAITLSAVQSEMARRAKTRAPMGEMPQETVADEVVKRAGEASIGQPRVGMYGGGIVALQGGGQPEDAYNPLANRFTGPMSAANPARNLFPASAPRALNYATADTPAVTLPTEPIPQPAPAPAPAPDRSLFNQIPTGTAPPAQGDPELDDRASPVGIELLNKQPPPPAPKEDPTAPAPSGTMQAGRPQLPSTFEQFKAMIPKGEMDPAQASILSDMQSRLDKKLNRAEDQVDNAIYDAVLMAGLSMMGGTSLADGIARAAQTGGATYMAGMKDANKAIDAASDAELAFRQYELEVMKGNDKAASDQFSKFLDYSTKLYDIDSRAATASAKDGLSTRQLQTMLNADDDFRLLFDAEKEALKTARETAPGTDAQREAQARAEAATKARKDYKRKFTLQALGISDSTAPALPEGFVED